MCHVIASIDHIRSGLLFSEGVSTAFNFIFEDATTFEPLLCRENVYDAGVSVLQVRVVHVHDMIVGSRPREWRTC